MKTEEDEAFDELAAKQGHWNGGFMAKKAMAADKMRDCIHGSLARSCQICDLEAEVEELKAALAYIAPPKREWVGLTEQERNNIEDDFSVVISIHVFDAIEAKLKEKNT
jgi:hypothetical protein